jgi:hypothetical protein
MTLDELYRTVTGSARDDWNVMICGGVAGPSYRDRFSQVEIGGRIWLEYDSYGMVAAYRSDLSISLAWGYAVGTVVEPWLRFADPEGRRCLVDLFYMGTLVDRRSYISVDGGRASLPMPEDRGGVPTVARRDSALVRLIDSLGNRESRYEEYFRRAGFQAVDVPSGR